MLTRAIDYSRRFLLKDANFRRLLSNTGVLLSANVVTVVISFIQGVIVARLLGVEQYGVLAVVSTYASVINQFVDSRAWEAAIKYVNQFREANDPGKAAAIVKLCYLVDAITGIFAFLILLLSAHAAARFFLKDPQLSSLIQIYSWSVILDIPLGTSTALLRIGNRFDWLSYHKIGLAVFKLIGAIVVVGFSMGVREILVAYLISTTLATLIIYFVSQQVAQSINLGAWGKSPLKLLSGQYRTIASFMIYSNLGGTSRLITSKADTLILGWFGTPTVVGLYRLARNLSDPLNIIFSALYTAIYPEMAKLAGQGNLAQIRSLQKRVSTLILALVIPVGLGLTIVITWAVPVIYGSEYTDAILMAQILVWQIVWTPLIWLPGLLLSLGKTRLLAGFNWLDAFNYLILLILLVPAFQGIGAAVATLLRFIIWTGVASIIILNLQRTQNKVNLA